jgi:hypothetical protein
MVQRTGLAVILLLAWLAGSLSAQAAAGFTPPRLASEAILDIPADWEQNYTPPEVMILVEIKADSTALLVKILDGKAELQPLIENLLPYLVFYPAVADSQAIDTTLSLKLAIRREGGLTQETKQEMADSLKQVKAEEITGWINQQRQAEDRQTLFSSSMNKDGSWSPQLYDTFYRTNYFMLGLNSKPRLIRKDGWLQSASVYYNALQYQMLSNFRQVKATNSVIDFANERYPYPAMCTDIYAGLGDYEYNFARALVRKNHVLGVKDFYLEAGLLVQNGWWQETISNQTSSRIFLSLPVSGTTLSLNWEKYDHNIPSTALLAGLWTSSPFQIAQILSDVYLNWQLPWFTLGWQTQTEKLSRSGHLNKQEYNNSRLLLNTDYQTAVADLDFSYQYNYQLEHPQVQSLYQYNNFSEHQVYLNAGKHFGGLDYSLQSFWTENGFDLGTAEAGYTSSLGRLGALYSKYNGNNTSLADSVFYVNTAALYYPSVYAGSSFAGKYSFTSASHSLALDLSFGSKTLSVKQNDAGRIALNADYNCLFGESLLQLHRRMGKYTASYEQTCLWNQYLPDLPDLPEVQGQAVVKLERDMGYHNTLSAGLNLTGHSDYSGGDPNLTSIYGALVTDAWLGVKISDLFEFRVIMSNLNGNVIYGVYPHPRTILATIHWFYLN